MDATIWKVWLTVPKRFWLSLFVVNTVMYVLPLQASSSEITPLQNNEVQNTVEISSAPQSAGFVDVSAETLSVTNVTSVNQLAANPENIGTNKVQDNVTIPSTTALKTDAIKASTEAVTPSDVPAVSELTSNEADSDVDDPMSQVTNVTQLGDVSPGDWAFEALRSLVERYGCIAGYPDRTFRGNRAMSRYEFAAGLNACLQQVERLIATSTSDFVRRQDLETLRRLIDEFKTELATLSPRLDKLDGRVAFLENHQFSTTTKLSGLAWFNLTGAFADGTVKAETTNINAPLEIRPAGRDFNGRPIIQNAKDPSITLSNLVWLSFDTSFTGKDNLVIQLAAGNGNSPANAYASAGLYNTFGTPFLDQTAGPNVGVNEVIIRDLFYRFSLTDNFQVVFGPRVNWYRYFDNNAYNFFLTGTSTFNSNGSTLLNTIERGSGVVLLWDINKQFKLRVAYLGENNEFLPSQFGFNSSSNPAKGLFSPTNTTTAELTFSPSSTFNLRLLYNYSNIDPTVPIFSQLPDGRVVQTGIGVGGAVSEPIYGVADDGFGGSISNAIAHTFAVNFDWQITRGIGLFGRYSYGNTNIQPTTPGRSNGHVNAQSIQAGLAFPDLGKQGALATLSFLIPYDVVKGRRFLAAGGGNGGTQYDFEAAYYYPLSNNIAIVPAFYLIVNPNNFSDNPNIYVGNLRAQFNF